MAQTIAKVIMWIMWIFWGMTALFASKFLTENRPNLNSFAKPFDLFAVIVFLLAIIPCVGFRFWLAKVRNPWIALVLFFIGINLVYLVENYGFFMLMEYCIVFQVLCGVFFFIYLPLFIKLESKPQPAHLPPPIDR
jgi:hypothetical protein